MKGLVSLASERFRTSFLVVYVLSSLLPTLILILIVNRYVQPYLTPDQAELFRDPATYGLAAMLAVPFLGYLLMSWWINSLEKLTEEIKAKTADVLQERIIITEKNELITLHRHLDGLYGELQGKIKQLNEYSEKLVESKKKLTKISITDELTTLFNRRYFDRRLLDEIKKAEKRKNPLALIMVDIDGFKQYNEQYGHPAGDKLLRAVGLLIRDYVRKPNLPFRYGGDEFAIILPEAGIEEAAAKAHQLTEAASHLAIQGVTKGEPLTASVSCGVISYDRAYMGLFVEADRCIEQAISSKKGSVILLTPRGRQA